MSSDRRRSGIGALMLRRLLDTGDHPGQVRPDRTGTHFQG